MFTALVLSAMSFQHQSAQAARLVPSTKGPNAAFFARIETHARLEAFRSRLEAMQKLRKDAKGDEAAELEKEIVRAREQVAALEARIKVQTGILEKERDLGR
jgi:hypothetical protein